MPSITDAVDAYLTDIDTELADSTVRNRRYQLGRWVDWVDNRDDVNVVNDIDPVSISQFKRVRSEEIGETTLYNQLSAIREWVKYCERMGWISGQMTDTISLPTRSNATRSRSINKQRGEDILDELEKYAYASIDHTIWSILWTTGLRAGSLRAIDIDDYHPDERYIEVHHRPGTGTSLKNKHSGERQIALHGWVADVIDAWTTDIRPGVTDDYGRNPLVATVHGRASVSTIRRRVYRITACGAAHDAPYCTCDADRPSKCDESVSPHDIRRSVITHTLDEGARPETVSGRCDVSPDTINEHYDVRTEAEKRELRREKLGI